MASVLFTNIRRKSKFVIWWYGDGQQIEFTALLFHMHSKFLASIYLIPLVSCFPYFFIVIDTANVAQVPLPLQAASSWMCPLLFPCSLLRFLDPWYRGQKCMLQKALEYIPNSSTCGKKIVNLEPSASNAQILLGLSKSSHCPRSSDSTLPRDCHGLTLRYSRATCTHTCTRENLHNRFR